MLRVVFVYLLSGRDELVKQGQCLKGEVGHRKRGPSDGARSMVHDVQESATDASKKARITVVSLGVVELVPEMEVGINQPRLAL